MIKTIRIQNFRSLQDVTLDLQDVNLLIGPNNSGKTNLMKAFKFLGEFFRGATPQQNALASLFFLRQVPLFQSDKKQPIVFTITDNHDLYRLEIFGYTDNGILMLNQFMGRISPSFKGKILNEIDLDNIPDLEKNFYDFYLQIHLSQDFFKKAIAHNFVQKALLKQGSFTVYYRSSSQPNYELSLPASLSTFVKTEVYIRDNDFFDEVYLAFLQPKIYSINISKLKEPYPLRPQDNSIDSDGSNLVSFIDTMKDKHDEIMSSINKGLRDCIKEFKSISLDNVELEKDHVLKKLHGERTFKKLGVKDKNNQIYWADELSDGTLYFLALLAIIHQPDPPKLLMVEEPENGIHPRRIKEIIDYFFTIAQDKGIQVILTTHNTFVIDQFKDMPESIFVFDKKDQATQVKNLATDIIPEDIESSKKNNVPPLDLSGSLGDHWAAGLIGGVPK